MSRIFLSLICLMCFSPALRAQKETDKIACYAYREDNAPTKRISGTATKSRWGRWQILKKSRTNARQPSTTARAGSFFEPTDSAWCSMRN